MISSLRIVINHFPRFKAFLKPLFDMLFSPNSVSSHYIQVSTSDEQSEASRLRSAWKAEDLPRRQRDLVNPQLVKFRLGIPVDVFDSMVEMFKKIWKVSDRCSVIEIGCSSGFYSEVFDVAGLRIDYSGCDYAEAFINLARSLYPSLRFDVADATSLPYADSSFDVAISGCCLLHIPEFPAAVSETARVARSYAIFHRTPVLIGSPTKYFRKQAYGIETVEIHFNETELLTLFNQCGLELIDTYTIDEYFDPDNLNLGNANRSYVCRKIIR